MRISGSTAGGRGSRSRGLGGRAPGQGLGAVEAGPRVIDATGRRAPAGSGPQRLDRGGAAARVRADPGRRGRRRGPGGGRGSGRGVETHDARRHTCAGSRCGGAPVRRRSRWWGVVTLAALATSLALTALAAAQSVRDAGPVRDLAEQRATVLVLGRVSTDPRAVDAPPGRPSNAAGVVLRLDVDHVEGRGVETDGRVTGTGLRRPDLARPDLAVAGCRPWGSWPPPRRQPLPRPVGGRIGAQERPLSRLLPGTAWSSSGGHPASRWAYSPKRGRHAG